MGVGVPIPEYGILSVILSDSPYIFVDLSLLKLEIDKSICNCILKYNSKNLVIPISYSFKGS